MKVTQREGWGRRGQRAQCCPQGLEMVEETESQRPKERDKGISVKDSLVYAASLGQPKLHNETLCQNKIK